MISCLIVLLIGLLLVIISVAKSWWALAALGGAGLIALAIWETIKERE